MKPIFMTSEELVLVLRDMAERVEKNDSFEGSIEYTLPDILDAQDGFRVRASYRVGNLNGQGSMRMVGTF